MKLSLSRSVSRKIGFVWCVIIIFSAGLALAEEREYSSVPIDEGQNARQVFGHEFGYIHPLFSLAENFTDNYYYSSDNEKSEYLTTISPGIYLSLPASRQQFQQLEIATGSPGGLALSRLESEAERRFQAYGLYRAGIEEHKDFPEDNMTTQRAEGLVRYNFRGGLSVELLNLYNRDYESYTTGSERDELDKFQSNLIDAVMSYRISPKFRLRGDYSHYTLRYDADRNAYRDRDDDAFAFYIFYKALPKTSIFAEYEWVDIGYQNNDYGDSREQHYFTGLDWNITTKSRGRIKVGYGIKSFHDEAADDRNDIIFETQIDHRFTRKSSMSIKFARKTREADIANTQDILTNSFRVGYTQNLTAKFAASLEAAYVHDSYSDDLTVDEKTDKRSESYYSGGLKLEYSFVDWLKLNAGYVYRTRNSNFETYDYQCHLLYLGLNVAL